MVLKFIIVLSVICLIQTAQGASVAGQNVVDETPNTDLKELETMLIREIFQNAALRDKLKELSELESSEENDDGTELTVAKRFPKWRSGDTRSRVRLLHQNEGRNQAYNGGHASSADYSAALRNRWENNMLEKNKMYQNLLG